MKKFIKVVLYCFAGIVVIALAGLLYLNMAFPKVSKAPDIKVESNQEQIKRGEYLANHVTVCIDCHSKRDWQYFSGPLPPSDLGSGGDMFDEPTAGVPGVLYAKNITPNNLASWTDGEIYHAITTGVSKSGSVIFPIMPWPAYSKMDPEDTKAIIAYLRSLTPVKNEIPESKLNFPLNLIVKTFPEEPKPLKRPNPADSIEYGKYLTTIAACADCHTPVKDHNKIPGMEYAGGFEFKMGPMGLVRSANITPDVSTGIGAMTAEQFVQRFKTFASEEAKKIKTNPGEMQTVMPWTMYAGMSEGDLRSIYHYLKTLPAVSNKVERYIAKY